MGRIIIDRIQRGVDEALRKEQAGFRRNRSTVEQIFVLRNIMEQVKKWRATLYTHFIDFEKAFDSIHRESLWKIMKSYGIPEKLVKMVKIMYEDFECTVMDDGGTDEVDQDHDGSQARVCYVRFSLPHSNRLGVEKDDTRA